MNVEQRSSGYKNFLHGEAGLVMQQRVTLESYVNVDEGEYTCGPLTDAEATESVHRDQAQPEDPSTNTVNDFGKRVGAIAKCIGSSVNTR